MSNRLAGALFTRGDLRKIWRPRHSAASAVYMGQILADDLNGSTTFLP